MTSRGTRCLTTGVLLVALAACGSTKGATKSTSATTSLRPSGSGEADTAFKARAVAMCTAAGDKLHAQGPFPAPNFDPEHPDASKFPAIAAYEAKTVATLRAWQSQLHALGQPSTGSAAWATFLAAVDRAVKSTVAQQAAAQHDASGAFTQTFHDLSSQGLAGTQAAQATGVPLCDPSNPGTTPSTTPTPVPLGSP
jgi:hypothetical protein